MKNKDTSLGVIFTYCRSRCLTSGRDVAKCTDALCSLHSRRMGHDPNRGHQYRGNLQKREKPGLTPIQDGVKKILRAIPGKIEIPEGYELVLKKKDETV